MEGKRGGGAFREEESHRSREMGGEIRDSGIVLEQVRPRGGWCCNERNGTATVGVGRDAMGGRGAGGSSQSETAEVDLAAACVENKSTFRSGDGLDESKKCIERPLARPSFLLISWSALNLLRRMKFPLRSLACPSGRMSDLMAPCDL